jgi:CheY-like chemotaxis protein
MNKRDAILVVDDDADSRDSLKMLLELDGYRAFTAASADEAIKAVATQQPICVILDLHMPGVGGVELAQRIRAAHGNAIVLLVLTGSTSADDEDAAERSGVDYVLHKPVDPARLRRLLPH